MHISGIFIDGFGIYHNLSLDGLTVGLVCCCGENESGKTTLMEFIRTMLFGPRRRANNLYPPLAGGEHGGRLELTLADGRLLLLDRHGKRVTVTTGEGVPLSGEPADLVLGGLDRDSFQQIFALGLQDLQGLEVLSRDQVRSRLFAAGAGLGATALPAAMAKIDKELKELVTPAGKGGVILQMTRMQRDLHQQINDLQRQGPEYAQVSARRQDLEEQIARLSEEQVARRARRRQLELFAQAREPYARLLQARTRAAEFAGARDFLLDSLPRWEDLARQLGEVDQGIEENQARQEEWQGELGRIPEDTEILAQEEAITALGGEREKFATAIVDCPGLQNQVAQAEAELQRRLRELGPGWDTDILTQFDTSLPVRQEVQHLARELGAAERFRDECGMRLKLARLAVAEAQETLKTAEARQRSLVPPPLEEEALRRQTQGVSRLRVLITQREILRERQATREASARDLAARQHSLTQQLEVRSPPLSLWLAIGAGMVGLVGATMVGWRKSYILAWVCAMAGVALAVLMLITRSRQRQANTRRCLLLEEELAQVGAAHGEVTQELEQIRSQEEALCQDLEQTCQDAGLPSVIDLRDVEALASRLEDAALTLRRWEEADTARTAASAELARVERRRDQAEAEAVGAADAMGQREESWRGWLKTRRVDLSVRPENFEEIVQLVEHARAAARTLEEARQRLKTLAEYVAKTRRHLAQVLADCKRTGLEEEPGVADLDGLCRALNLAQEHRRQRRELERMLAAASRDQEHLQERRRALEEQQQCLLGQTGVSGEEELRRQAAALEKWRTWQEVIDRAEVSLGALVGEAEARLSLEEELGRLDFLVLATEEAELDRRLEDIEGELTQAHQEIGKLSRRLADLAANEELGRLLFQERALHREVTAATQRWATLTLTRHLLDQARSLYEEQRQPQVIQEADRCLSTMTRRSHRLVALADSGQISLEDEHRRRRREPEWSAGLADQVFLALRLGLARQFSYHGEPLPVILDDILVKFDPHRQLGAARLLLDFSRQQQVFFFTCHPQFKDLLIQARDEIANPATLVCYEVHGGCLTRSP